MMIETGKAERVKAVANLQEYFRDSVGKALCANGVTVDEHTSHYVVNLLARFARSENFYEDTADGAALRPLALMLNDAINAPNQQARRQGLKRLGDVALFVAGFFAGSFRSRPVDVDYFMGMGGTAYSYLADALRDAPQGNGMASVYDELASQFQPLVAVLNQVADQRARASQSASRLYDIWLRTGSHRAANMLRRQGVYPLHAATSVTC